jgi:lysophospholipase L1-like esterase
VIRRLPLLLLLALVLLGAVTTAGASAKSKAKPKPSSKSPAVTTASPLTRGSAYLALGDSVTFGYQEPETTPAPNYKNAASFPGYPEQIAKQLKVKVTNLACPGETSASFINTSAPSLGCQTYRKAFPLHVRYRGSQLSNAVTFLRKHSSVRLVSLMIGANDAFLCQGTTPDHCLNPAEQKAVFAKISRNVRRILSAVRNQAHYKGQLAIVNYYSLNYGSPLVNSQSQALNQAQDSAAKPFHVVFANGYGEFQAASVKYANQPCLAGLITQLNATVGSCGVHPTYSGQTLLSSALLKAIRL